MFRYYDGDRSLTSRLKHYKDEEAYMLQKLAPITKTRQELEQKYTASLEMQKLFREKYSVEASDVVFEYRKLVDSCSYQGGRGYALWVRSTYKDIPHHWVVDPDKYQMCQPTERDQEAYMAICGEKIEVTTQTHIERWGN